MVSFINFTPIWTRTRKTVLEGQCYIHLTIEALNILVIFKNYFLLVTRTVYFNQITKSMKKLILIQIFFTLGLSAFSQVYRNPSKIEAPGYDSLLNKSRTISGSNSVERKAELDSYCKERCIRLIEILIKNPKYIIKSYKLFR